MAKNKKQDRNLAETQKSGRNGEKKSPKPQDIDVSSESLEEMESDSDLDIQALLRKYMPDYDKEDEDSGADEGNGVLTKLKNSADFALDARELEDFDLPELDEPEPEPETDELPGFAGLDAAFSSDMPEDSGDGLGEFDFTDDIPAQIDDDEGLVDEEGIYEDDDDERISRKPRRKEPKQKRSLFAFGRKKDKKKAADYEEELLQLAEETDEAEAALPEELFAKEDAEAADVGTAMMDSMGLDAEEA